MVAKAVLAVLIGVGGLLALGGPAAVAQEPPGGPPPATTETGAPPETQQADTALLPVDALVDSDTPIEGARIRVLDRDGQPIKQVDGSAADRTNDNGVAVLEFPDLPGSFTVEVGGGRANGGRFDATLSTEVVGYDSAEGDVVLVDPVSTIAAADGVTLGEAKRLLGIPDWFSDTDFLFSDTYFDAGAFLRAADRADGVDGLIDGLVDEQRADHSTRRPFRAADAAKATAAAGGVLSWIKLAAKAATGDWFPLAKEVLSTLVDTAASKLKGPLVGWVMQQIGLGGDEEKKGKEEMKTALKAIGEAIVGLHSKVNSVLTATEKTNFNTLYQSTRADRVAIDLAIEQLFVVAKMSPGDPKAVTEKNVFKAHVETEKLATAVAGNLNDALNPSGPEATGLIASASSLVKARGHPFFDTDSSKRVERVLGWFALYEVRLALVVAEYKHLTGASAESSLSAINANVANQVKALKPTVPAGAVIDTRTNKMWTQSYTPNPRDANAFFKVDWNAQHTRPEPVFPVATHGPLTIPGMDFKDWVLPGKGDFEALVAGRGGQSGTDFLKDKARMSAQQVNAAGGEAFMAQGDGWEFHFPGPENRVELTISRFDLAKGKVDRPADRFGRPRPIVWCGGKASVCDERMRTALGGVKGAVLYVRPLAKNESYWYE